MWRDSRLSAATPSLGALFTALSAVETDCHPQCSPLPGAEWRMSRQSTAHRRPPIHSCPSRSSHSPVRPALRVCAWLCTPVRACVHECACARVPGGEVAASPDWSGCGPWVPPAGTVGFPPSLFQSGKDSSWLRELLVLLVFPVVAPRVGWGAELRRPQKVFRTPRRESARKKRAPPWPSPARVPLLPPRPATAEAREERPVRRLVRRVWLPLLQAAG